VTKPDLHLLFQVDRRWLKTVVQSPRVLGASPMPDERDEAGRELVRAAQELVFQLGHLDLPARVRDAAARLFF
jgi:hypothetical protein